MKKTVLILITAFLMSDFCAAQGPAKAIFFELGGPGLASLNYDMRFQNSEKGLGGRLGIGGFSLSGDDSRFTAVFVPAAVNYIMSKDDKNYLELGAGVTAVILRDGSADKKESLKSSFYHVDIAYRLQPKEDGFFFRAAITPIFNKHFFWPYYA
ncbi:MAG: hypothetical protein EOO13_14325, partial [Chitinophagaceae bacterium]